ncbi:DUF4349 domain-containing protein [Georgenia sp. EYE_87]|uniref:DUF4349 domain-containing protein n=1 Tax=Georgenia sp. EYE_87 TaxID=2853448 RepID=UPI0020033267|nr:DUF4349 domain-containing protein [Georgenia sp. EYE_87]MCK6209758.1 DUF4349 domain-containing protein [Georgenia sp. EYE_87]
MRRLRWFLALLCGVLLLAGCTSGSEDASDESGGGGVPAQDAGGDGAEGEGAGADDGGGEDRQVVTTADATVVVDDPAAAADEVAALAERAGGRVDQRNGQAAGAEGTDSRPSAWLTVRIPADQLSTVLDQLEAVGEVRQLSQDSTDVTSTTRDLDARITALRTSVDRLLGIMADADDSTALIAAESAISERQAELESLQSERAHLADQVAMSTLRVELVARDDPVVVNAGGFVGGLRTGWDALVTALDGLLVGLGVLLPWLVVIGVPAAAVLWFARRRRRTAG